MRTKVIEMTKTEYCVADSRFLARILLNFYMGEPLAPWRSKSGQESIVNTVSSGAHRPVADEASPARRGSRSVTRAAACMTFFGQRDIQRQFLLKEQRIIHPPY